MRRGGECLGVGRVACVLHYLLLLLPFAMSMVSVVDSGVRRPPVYWNSSNAMFHSSNNDHVIEVNIGDSIDIICPHYTDTASSWEYYIVYMVDKMNYDSCVINDTSQKMKILNCSKPNSTTPHYYTLLVMEFQPIPGNPDFQVGQSYYFISTSGGQEKELDNQYQGACYEHKMRMILQVIPPDNSRTTTRRPTTTPRGGHTPQPATTPTTPSTTSSTTPTTTTKSTTISATSKSTGKSGGGGGGDGFPIDDKNVIHVGGGGGDKNEGTITDSAGVVWRFPSASLLCLLSLIALLLR